ncbi:MAG: InlB B-repeat-containing protein, partial [Lachnospiraceae bacterium]|nr:InlB B-repeat-containing protein [Lachnospiraceae bacterium]
MKKQTIVTLLMAFLFAVVMLPMTSKDVNAAVATWTVTYHTNGGDSIPSERVLDGDYCSRPTPTREGYVFQGWYTNAELTRYYSGSEVHENLDLYAKWDVLVTKVEASVNLPVAGEHP